MQKKIIFDKTKAKPTIIDVVIYPWVKFPTLIQEHHNDSLMLLLVNMFSVARDGFSPAIHRYTAANIQRKNERTKKREKNLDLDLSFTTTLFPRQLSYVF